MGDTPEGFEEFVEAASPRLLRTAFLLTRDEGHAEDLLQTALARAWSRVRCDPERAELMGCSVGTVKSQASRALAKLRLDDAFAREGVRR